MEPGGAALPHAGPLCQQRRPGRGVAPAPAAARGTAPRWLPAHSGACSTGGEGRVSGRGEGRAGLGRILPSHSSRKPRIVCLLTSAARSVRRMRCSTGCAGGGGCGGAGAEGPLPPLLPVLVPCAAVLLRSPLLPRRSPAWLAVPRGKGWSVWAPSLPLCCSALSAARRYAGSMALGGMAMLLGPVRRSPAPCGPD